MTFLPSQPSHGKFMFRNLNSTQYKIYARQYSKAKASGIRAVYAWMSGAGILGILKDISKGLVLNYGKRKFAGVCINACTYIMSPALATFTNASRIVKISKSLHSAAAYTFECIEDSSNLTFLPLDLILFGQPIPIGASNRFNLFRNNTDFLDI